MMRPRFKPLRERLHVLLRSRFSRIMVNGWLAWLRIVVINMAPAIVACVACGGGGQGASKNAGAAAELRMLQQRSAAVGARCDDLYVRMHVLQKLRRKQIEWLLS